MSSMTWCLPTPLSSFICHCTLQCISFNPVIMKWPQFLKTQTGCILLFSLSVYLVGILFKDSTEQVTLSLAPQLKDPSCSRCCRLTMQRCSPLSFCPDKTPVLLRLHEYWLQRGLAQCLVFSHWSRSVTGLGTVWTCYSSQWNRRKSLPERFWRAWALETQRQWWSLDIIAFGWFEFLVLEFKEYWLVQGVR